MGQQPKQVQQVKEKQPRVTIHLDDSSDDSLELIDGKGYKVQVPYTNEGKNNFPKLTIGNHQQPSGTQQQPPSSSGSKRKQYSSQKRIVTTISVNKQHFTTVVQHCKKLFFEEI
ncbi:unnamed protein product [Meloidogyne enterolobii]|uniref:Uncharacterized protein n=1 Tax=Meloidogyne enterolobii TaxID=390850 RepID=A0ACB1A9M6_MELEN